MTHGWAQSATLPSRLPPVSASGPYLSSKKSAGERKIVLSLILLESCACRHVPAGSWRIISGQHMLAGAALAKPDKPAGGQLERGAPEMASESGMNWLLDRACK